MHIYAKATALLVAATLLLALNACAPAGRPDAKLERPLLSRQEMSRRFTEDVNWWQGYHDPALNRHIELALQNNTDLAKSALRIHKALVNAQLAGADLFPTASGELGASARRELASGSHSHSYQSTLGLQYELDLWQRFSNRTRAQEWEHEATLADRESVRLSLIHSVVNAYYNLRYLMAARQVQEKSIARYRDLLALVRAKAEQGKVSPVELQESARSLLAAEGNLSSLLAEEATTRQTLAGLLNCQAGALPPVSESPLLELTGLPVDLEVPVSALAARPDLQAAEARFAAAFYDLQSSSASWYPALSLGGVLGTSASHQSQFFTLPFLNGTLGLSLPFLDWARVRAKVQISKDDYELARLDFINAVTVALNEVWASYRISEERRKELALLQERLGRDEAITAHYQARYRLGASELKDYLEALNSEDSTRQSLLQAKYALLRDESTVYRAMGGRFLVRR